MRTTLAKRTRQTLVKPRMSTRMESFPAPTRGWIKNENKAQAKPGGADVLDNFFPTATGTEVRGGSSLYATVGSGERVGAIIPYVAGSVRSLFAADSTDIYDITTVADPEVSPSSAVAGLTSSDWQFVQFTTSGGTYLRLVNGMDTPLVYDGATWDTSPAITGTGLTATNLSHVWPFKNRLFFVEKNTLNAWYLATDAIGGSASKLPLGGVFKLGGALVFGAAWSADTGSGFGEKCVFVSSEGEVAVYEGTDPASPTTWALEGVYRIGRPLGPRAVFKAGGDVAIATDIGIVPLSQAITVALGALGNKAITRLIEDAWTAEVAQRVGVYPWHVEMWPTKQRMLVAMPSYSSFERICFVANIRTGAWCRYTGWDTHSLGLYQDRLFFGTSDGKVIEAEVGGSDQGDSYTAAYVGLYDNLGSPGITKVTTLMRPVYLTNQDIGDKVSVCVDYVPNLPTAPSAAAIIPGPNDWDVGEWGVAEWQESPISQVSKDWRAVGGLGEAIAPAVQITVGQEAKPNIVLIRTDLQYQQGISPG